MASNFSTNNSTKLTASLVRKTLFDFAKAMCDWELWVYKKGREDIDSENENTTLRTQARTELEAIFSHYVIKKNRNYDRIENLVCGHHPEYIFNKDLIELDTSNEKSATVIFEKNSGLTQKYRVTFTIENETCKISKREYLDDEKWRRTYV